MLAPGFMNSVYGAAISVVRESGSLHIYNTTVLVTDNTPVSKALTESLAWFLFREVAHWLYKTHRS